MSKEKMKLADYVHQRKISFGEIFINSLTIFKNNFIKICLLCIVVFLPISIVEVFLLGNPASEILDLVYNGYEGGIIQNYFDLVLTEAFYSHLLAVLLLTMLRGAFMTIILSSSFLLAKSEIFGFDQKFPVICRASVDSWIRMALISGLYNFIFIFSFSLFFPVGIYLGVIFAFSPYASIDTGKWLYSFAESAKAVKENWLRSLGFIIALFFIEMVISIPFSIIGGFFTGTQGDIITIILNVFPRAFSFISMSVYYLNIKSMKQARAKLGVN